MTGPSKTLHGTLDLLVLKTLEREPNHGFGITLHIRTASEGTLRVEEGSLYPALRRLERDKVIVGEWQTTENGRRARAYQLTDAGAKRLAETEEDWVKLTRDTARFLEYSEPTTSQ
jgi:transcriptional regulator